MVAGCSTLTGEPARFEPVQIPADETALRITVYGSLTALLPHYDTTPALEMFLYGPNDYGKTALRNPQGMTVFGDQLLVCDQGRPDVVAINLRTGRSLPFIHPDHRPRCPVDVAADADHVYVADTTSRCIAVYDPRGRLLEELAPASQPDRAFRPAAVLIRTGVLYAGNIGERRVDRYNLESRTWLDPIAPPADHARLVAPAGLGVAADGTLLIVDAVQGHVLRLAPDGKWLAPLGRPGRGPGEFVRPKQVCQSASGWILVSDAGRQSVLVFDSGGRYLAEIHATGRDWEGLTLPMGVIALTPDELDAIRGGIPQAAGATEDYLVISDSLGGMPLTLVGIARNAPAEVAHAP